MNRLVLLVALALPIAAFGQQPSPPPDGRLDAYRQLLSEANDRIVALVSANQMLQQQLQRLQEMAAKAKPPKEEQPAQ